MKLKQCDKGFNCGFGCINKQYKCKSNVNEAGNKVLETYANYLSRTISSGLNNTDKPLQVVPKNLAELEPIVKAWQKVRGFEEPALDSFNKGTSAKAIKGLFSLHDSSHPLTYTALGKSQKEIQAMYGAPAREPFNGQPSLAEEIIVRANELAALGNPVKATIANIENLARSLAVTQNIRPEEADWLKAGIDYKQIAEDAQKQSKDIKAIFKKNLENRLYAYDNFDKAWVFVSVRSLPNDREDYFNENYLAD